MNYSVLYIGPEYMSAEECMKNGDIENAIKHYREAIDNYNYADDEHMLHPNHPYSITMNGETTEYPSPNKMLRDASDKIHKLEKILRKQQR